MQREKGGGSESLGSSRKTIKGRTSMQEKKLMQNENDSHFEGIPYLITFKE